MSEIVPYKNYQDIVSYGRSPEVMETFALLLGRDAPHYVQSAIMAVKANDRLLECTPRSIFSSALRAATLRLSCDPMMGHAWLVPYKNNSKGGVYEAQFQAGWRGVQHMALRTGKYRYINVSPVYAGEQVDEDRISGELRISGAATAPLTPRGLIASFALLSGYKKSIFMTNDEMEAHGKRYSKAYNKADGVWNTNKPAAYHKTILLKLLRTYGYIDPTDAAVLDDEQASVSDIELPDEDAVTIVEPKTISMNEANGLLGYGDEAEDAVYYEAEPTSTPEPPSDPFDDYLIDEIVTKPQARAAAKAADTPELPAISLEEAYRMTNSQGREYGGFTVATLEKIISAMWKQIKENNLGAGEKAEILRKIAAAKTVLDAKKDGSIQ